MTIPFRDLRAARLADEVGTIYKQAGLPFALCYPSPYTVGMSSLGFQTIYRGLNALPGVAAERAFLPDDAQAARAAGEPLRDLRVGAAGGRLPGASPSRSPTSWSWPGWSTASTWPASRASPRSAPRTPNATRWSSSAGPSPSRTPSPPRPTPTSCCSAKPRRRSSSWCEAIRSTPSRAALLETLAARPGFYVPPVHGERTPPVAAADDALLPAHSQIRTPHTELSNMFLIEPERGCHRGCTYCVMRRSTNGGMRLVDPARVAALIPADARRVGLVGAAVTDHPRLPEILRHLVDSDREVGISSLRADRLNDEIVGLLKRGGYRTLTTAADGASERMRDVIQRKTKERHLLRAAELARAHGMSSSSST